MLNSLWTLSFSFLLQITALHLKPQHGPNSQFLKQVPESPHASTIMPSGDGSSTMADPSAQPTSSNTVHHATHGGSGFLASGATSPSATGPQAVGVAAQPATAAAQPSTINLIFTFSTPKMYTISLLVSLNSRHTWACAVQQTRSVSPPQLTTHSIASLQWARRAPSSIKSFGKPVGPLSAPVRSCKRR